MERITTRKLLPGDIIPGSIEPEFVSVEKVKVFQVPKVGNCYDHQYSNVVVGDYGSWFAHCLVASDINCQGCVLKDLCPMPVGSSITKLAKRISMPENEVRKRIKTTIAVGVPIKR